MFLIYTERGGPGECSSSVIANNLLVSLSFVMTFYKPALCPIVFFTSKNVKLLFFCWTLLTLAIQRLNTEFQMNLIYATKHDRFNAKLFLWNNICTRRNARKEQNSQDTLKTETPNWCYLFNWNLVHQHLCFIRQLKSLPSVHFFFSLA